MKHFKAWLYHDVYRRARQLHSNSHVAGMILRDSWGWPIELVRGQAVRNILRRLFHTNCGVTWKHRHDGWPVQAPDPNVAGSAEDSK